MNKIYMIFASGCPECATMKQTISSVIKHENLKAELLCYNCESDEAVSVALENNICDIPGCYINGEVFEGEKYDREALVAALKKLS